MHVLQDGLVPVPGHTHILDNILDMIDIIVDTLDIQAPGRHVEQDHVLGPRVFEHPVLADPLLTQLPDLVLGLLPAEKGTDVGDKGAGGED